MFQNVWEQQLSSERQAFKIYKKDAEAAQKSHAALETTLRSKLAEADQVSAQQQKDIKRLTGIEADLVKENGVLESRLDRERKGTGLILKQMGELREDLSAKVEDLQAQLSTERQNLHKLKEALSEARTRKDLIAQKAESLRSQLTNERQNAQDQHRELKIAMGQEVAIREEHSNERQLSDQLRSKFVDMRVTISEQFESGCQFDLGEHFSFSEELKTHFSDVETTQALLIRVLKSLRSELDTERAKGVQLEQEVSTMEAENAALMAQLSNELQKSEKVRKALVMVETEQTVLYEDIKVLQAQLATTHETAERLECELSTTKGEKLILTSHISNEQQELENIRNSLRQVETEKAGLHKERDHFQMQLAAEQQKAEQLYHEINATKAKEATLSTQLEEQKAVAAAQEAIYSADRSRLLEQIAKLERYSMRIDFKALYGRVKGLVKVAFSWVTGGRWRKRVVSEGDMEPDVS